LFRFLEYSKTSSLSIALVIEKDILLLHTYKTKRVKERKRRTGGITIIE